MVNVDMYGDIFSNTKTFEFVSSQESNHYLLTTNMSVVDIWHLLSSSYNLFMYGVHGVPTFGPRVLDPDKLDPAV